MVFVKIWRIILMIWWFGRVCRWEQGSKAGFVAFWWFFQNGLFWHLWLLMMKSITMMMMTFIIIMMLLMMIIIQITISFKYPVCGLRSRFWWSHQICQSYLPPSWLVGCYSHFQILTKLHNLSVSATAPMLIIAIGFVTRRCTTVRNLQLAL